MSIPHVPSNPTGDNSLRQLSPQVEFLSKLKQAFYGMLHAYIGLFSLPLEILCRCHIGRRYYSVFATFVSTWLLLTMHWLYRAFAGMLSILPGASKPHLPSPNNLLIFTWAICFVAIVKKVATLRRASRGVEQITTYSGVSLAPFRYITTALLKPFPKHNHLHEEITKRFVEPIVCFVVGWWIAVHKDPLLGWYVEFMAVMLFLRAQLAWTLIREQALDQYDAVLVSKMYAEDLKRRRGTDSAVGNQPPVWANEAIPAQPSGGNQAVDNAPADTTSGDIGAQTTTSRNTGITASDLLRQRVGKQSTTSNGKAKR